MKLKKALITGITGQDGSYLSELLLKKNYQVIGMMRRSSDFNTSRIDHLYKLYPKRFDTEYGDLEDESSINRLIKEFKPDEVYNLGAQSHVGISFTVPKSTFITNTTSVFNILEAIRHSGRKIKYYQASSSEMFGATPPPQNEKSNFLPQSPYGISKVVAFHTTKLYRNAYNIFAANGILFNHESPRRGLNFVTRKITHNLAKIFTKEVKKIYLGNITIERDWGFAGDYVKAIWLILQQSKPSDYVISTGQMYSVKDFVEECFNLVGLDWKKYVVYNNKKYLRPAEVPKLKGITNKGSKKLKWKPKVNFKQLCKMMVESDLKMHNLDLVKAKKLAQKM